MAKRMSEEDQEAIAAFRSMAIDFGRAVSLSCVAAVAKPSIEDEAIAAADAAWTKLADKIIDFAMSDLT